MKKEIIEIQEEVQIGNVLLEKGDKIEVLKEDMDIRELSKTLSMFTIDYISMMYDGKVVSTITNPQLKKEGAMLSFEDRCGSSSNIPVKMIQGIYPMIDDPDDYKWIEIRTTYGYYEIGLV